MKFKISIKGIYNICYLSIIFMYFNFFSSDIGETQPIIIILFTIPCLFYYLRSKKNLKKDRLLLISIFITIMYFLIQCFQNTLSRDAILLLFKMIIGPITYICILKYCNYLEQKSVKIAIIILSIIFFIVVFKIPIFYSIIEYVYTLFFNRGSLSGNNMRGLNVLTPEPSYFAYFSILLLYSIDYLKLEKNVNFNFFYKVILVIISLASKSAIVYLFIALYFISFISFRNICKAIICFVVLFILLSFLDFEFISNNRFYHVIMGMINDRGEGFINLLFFSDESGGFRFLINSLYLLSVFIYPFGTGFVFLKLNWIYIADFFNIDYAKNMLAYSLYQRNIDVYAQAYLANYIGILGVFSLPLIIYIFRVNLNNNPRIKKMQISIIIILIAFLFFLQSNFLNPVFWILIGFNKRLEELK